MKFNPNVEPTHPSLAEGEAQFIIEEATDKLSSNGNQMTTLKLKIRDCNGSEGILWDNIAWILNWKIQQLFYSIGMHEEFATGDVPTHALVNKKGKCFLDWAKGEKGYPDKLKVKFYINPDKAGETNVSTSLPESHADFDDEIPF